MLDLPINECLDEIVDAVRDDIPVVLKAPPGAGKTTGVPPALLQAGVADAGQIILVQPRRLAARTAASRVAKLVGAKLGEDVGYHVRFDRKATQSTRVIVMTTGILLRRLNSDPLLEDVACVILDEFHERSLEMDLA
ncbi:MAG: DEAD/DEAH box helicase, partial [Pirellulaceae bacterium]